ncbi:hypothetical protein GEV33_015419 [Tenebrio molitor]|uniref:Uncharacterized protein n=1 Tax=Tenebrio molitor TaxID=7067 RepID=A0A8J6H3C6_TENMO|nr:hypothetical protein GEV33_015420 [Tenebrio molitor]KAH0807373.1 hypothetical protein GEV33_015419 [Tenebrio molitor]
MTGPDLFGEVSAGLKTQSGIHKDLETARNFALTSATRFNKMFYGVWKVGEFWGREQTNRFSLKICLDVECTAVQFPPKPQFIFLLPIKLSRSPTAPIIRGLVIAANLAPVKTSRKRPGINPDSKTPRPKYSPLSTAALVRSQLPKGQHRSANSILATESKPKTNESQLPGVSQMRLSLNLQRVSFYVREQIRAVPCTVDLGNLQLNVEPVAVTLARSLTGKEDETGRDALPELAVRLVNMPDGQHDR